MTTKSQLQARLGTDQIAAAVDSSQAAIIAQLTAERDALREQATRIAVAAMVGAEVVDSISYFNGIKQVAAYEKFDHIWMTTLTAGDMTFMRQAVGLPEPGDPRTPVDGGGTE